MNNNEVVFSQVLTEQNQGHPTRKSIISKLEEALQRPVVTFFTSFKFPVMIDDADADMLEGVLQKIDLSKGLALFINSPGGNGIAAERIINMCRSYSGTKEYWCVVPGKAKSAATMICFGASKVIMGATSELGPIDPQITIAEDNEIKRFSVYNIVKSYNDLFAKAVKEKSGNLQPYLQQLANYDAREIEEFRAAMSLSEDIAIRALSTGMMKGTSGKKIKEQISIFLTPERTKIHGRPIYRGEASKCCLNIEEKDVKDKFWELVYELYIRTNNYVSTHVAKSVEASEYSFAANIPRQR